MKISPPLLGILLGLATVTQALAADTRCSARSPEFRAALIELYTSEGCSSCPPADNWLRKLPREDIAVGRVVPLALHVDYWNYLGWHDPFSQAAFTTRQRTLAAHNRTRTIYTPGLFLNGREWRGWHRDELAARLARLATERPAASIELRAAARGNALRLEGTVNWSATPSPLAVLHLAVLENDLVTAVPAGENSGHTLRHGYVVRHLSDAFSLAAQTTPFEHRLALPRHWKRSNLSVAAFVEDRANGEILQAVMLSGCPG